MSYFISLNDLLEWKVGDSSSTERVLWIDSNYTTAIVIDIFAKTGFPIRREIVNILDAISDGEVTIQQEDPFKEKQCASDENLTKTEKMIRDKAHSIIASLVSEENEPAIYDRKTRGKIVRD